MERENQAFLIRVVLPVMVWGNSIWGFEEASYGMQWYYLMMGRVIMSTVDQQLTLLLSLISLLASSRNISIPLSSGRSLFS
jgi:hypothetical protein